MGVFTRTDSHINGRFIYANSNGQYLFYLPGGWRISSDYTSTSSDVRDFSGSTEYCPEANLDSQFMEWSGTAFTGGVSVVCRVSVVTEGCDSFVLSGANAKLEFLMDTYQRTDTRTPDGRWVYKHQSSDFYYFFGAVTTFRREWIVGADYKFSNGWIMLGRFNPGMDLLHPVPDNSKYVLIYEQFIGGRWVSERNIRAECSPPSSPTISVRGGPSGIRVRANPVPRVVWIIGGAVLALLLVVGLVARLIRVNPVQRVNPLTPR